MNKKISLGVALILLVCIGVGVGISQKEVSPTVDVESPEVDAEVAEKFAGLTYMVTAMENLQNATSFQGEFYNVLSSKNTSGELESVSTQAMISVVLDPFMIGMQEYTNYGDTGQISSVYLEEGEMDGDVQLINTYMSYGKGRSDEWTEMSLTQEGAHRFYDIYDGLYNMMVLMEAGTGWEEVGTVNGVVEVAGNIPAEKVFEVVNAGNFFKLGGMSGIDAAYFENVDAVPVRLSIGENGDPMGFTLDLTRSLNLVVQAVTEQLYSGGLTEVPVVQEYYIEQKINNLNDLQEIIIPDEAKEAINYEEEIAMMTEATEQAEIADMVADLAEEVEVVETTE